MNNTIIIFLIPLLIGTSLAVAKWAFDFVLGRLYQIESLITQNIIKLNRFIVNLPLKIRDYRYFKKRLPLLKKITRKDDDKSMEALAERLMHSDRGKTPSYQARKPEYD